MANLNQKTVETSIDAAIKSDNANGDIVKKAMAQAILFAAGTVGRVQPLNRLMANVTLSTREGCRQFYVNMTRVYGIEFVDEKTGNKRIAGFLEYSPSKKEFSHSSKPLAKQARDNIAKLSVDDLMHIVLGSMERDNSNNVERDGLDLDGFEKGVERLLKQAIKSGAIGSGVAGEFNKLISAARRVDAVKVQKETEEQADKLIKKAEMLKANAAKIKAANAEEKTEKAEKMEAAA